MQMRFAGSFFVPIFRGKSCSLVFLHSFPEGFRSGRHRKGAEMNQKNTEIDTSTMGGENPGTATAEGMVPGGAGIPDRGE